MFTATVTWDAAGPFDPFDLAGDDHGTSVAHNGQRIEAILNIDGPTFGAALDAAIAHCLEVIPGELVAGEITTDAEHDRRLEGPARPGLVGVSEIAEQLGVSRQRASALQTRSDFPAPAAVLRSGPVWYAADVATFVTDWSRRPGRPTSAQ